MQCLSDLEPMVSAGPGLGPSPDGRSKRAYIRDTVLRLGGLLGCQPREVKRLTEDLTRVPWQHCGCRELGIVLNEYFSIAGVVLAKRRREDRRVAAAQHGRGGRP